MPDIAPPDAPTSPCVICANRPASDRSQACLACAYSIDRDLTDWSDLVPLLPAAVAPSLQAWREPGARSTAESPLPGGEALNLTAGGSLVAPILQVPHFRTARTVTELVDASGKVVAKLERWSTAQVLDGDGMPVTVPDGDQYGQLPPALALARWVQDWAQLRGIREVGIPSPLWLRERLDWALASHPALAEFAGELHSLVDAMRAVLNVKPYIQRYPDPCPRCDSAGSCIRIVHPMDEDDSRAAHITCGLCKTMWTLDEWAHRAELAKELAA